MVAAVGHYMTEAIEQECTRRCYWLIYMVGLVTKVAFGRPMVGLDDVANLQLPVDETSFELEQETVPEFLHQVPPNTRYASEFGHLLRACVIHHQVEMMMDEIMGTFQLCRLMNGSILTVITIFQRDPRMLVI